MNVIGDIPHGNYLTTRKLSAPGSVSDLRTGIRQRNKRIIGQITRSNDEVLTQNCWKLSLAEFEKGRTARHVPVANADLSNAIIPPRLRKKYERALYISRTNPAAKHPYMTCILVQPSGGHRTPANWGGVSAFLQFLARRLLSSVVGAFVEDVYFVDPNANAASGFCSFNQLCELLRPNTSRKDVRPHTSRTHLLDADVSIAESRLRR